MQRGNSETTFLRNVKNININNTEMILKTQVI